MAFVDHSGGAPVEAVIERSSQRVIPKDFDGGMAFIRILLTRLRPNLFGLLIGLGLGQLSGLELIHGPAISFFTDTDTPMKKDGIVQGF
jgi:hypothetical protein